MRSGRVVAYEALSRFPDGRPPDLWFSMADDLGLGVQLELAAVRKALDLLDSLPVDLSLAVNVAPATLASGELATAITHYPHERIIIEVTERAAINEIGDLTEQAQVLRFRGARIAIDDLGSGRSRIGEILRLRPDIIKLDKSITSGVAAESTKRSLVRCVAEFGLETRTDIVAEGIETIADHDILLALGVGLGQGWLLGRPADPASVLARECLLREAGLTGAWGNQPDARLSPALVGEQA